MSSFEIFLLLHATVPKRRLQSECDFGLILFNSAGWGPQIVVTVSKMQADVLQCLINIARRSS